MVRNATPEDLDALVELGAVMHAESPRFSRLAFAPHVLRATLLHVMAEHFLMVAEEGGKIIGGMAAVCAPHWSSLDRVATDLALFIHPDHRGGIAPARLVNQYRIWARAKGAVLIDIGVNTGVQPQATAQLLARMGMRPCGFILEDVCASAQPA
ncbi:GNAT family N-acetyltransferase [Pseudorhodoferax sp.]|uniref:GNAT family N-acetyltransferase n=1 Tax=Pseudorhodoferax sp. TaxID=1993553 RepID=UPI0039E2EEAF